MFLTMKHILQISLTLTLFASTSVSAQDFPQRPITMVVGFGAGGGTDINARILAEVISRNLKQRVIVDNRTGAGGALAASFVQNARPDGYTLLVISGLQHAYLPAAQANVGYEPIRGFTPITTFFEMISVMSIPAEHPAKNVEQFLEYGRKKAGGLSLGAPGPGSPPHLFGALMSEATGVPIEIVQYRGSSSFMTDLVAGRIDLAFPTYGLAESFMAEKKTRALAVAADQRWSELPDLPTLVEAQLVRQMPAMWFGVVGPAGMPKELVQRINEEFQRAAKDPEVIRRINSTGMMVRMSAPEEMQGLMVAETSKVESLVKRLNLRQQ